MSYGMLDSFWSSLQRTEQRIEAEARDIDRTLYRTLYSYESRVMRLRWAIEASGPLARTEIAGKLKGISLDAIWSILISVVKDIALYYGGSIVLGTAVGAGLGSLAFGAGAVPGAALGFEAGVVLGEWVMTFLGLKMLAEGLIDTIPQAASCYVEGFRAAWGPSPSDRPGACHTAGYAPSKETAALQFAHGHVLMIMAILIAMVAYLLRGKSKEALFKAVGDSKRLGSKVADWLKENEGKLLKEENLQPKVRPQSEPQQVKAEQASSKASGAIGKQRVSDVRKVSAPTTQADRPTVKVQYTPLKGSEEEFQRQLAGQQAGLNKLTAGEIRSNIEAFNESGRPSSAADAISAFRRENPISEDPFVDAYMDAAPEGETPKFAALHEPDMVIGGRPDGITGYGDIRVNSSLGAQNAYRQSIIYDAVKSVPSDSYVNFIFEATGK